MCTSSRPSDHGDSVLVLEVRAGDIRGWELVCANNNGRITLTLTDPVTLCSVFCVHWEYNGLLNKTALSTLSIWVTGVRPLLEITPRPRATPLTTPPTLTMLLTPETSMVTVIRMIRMIRMIRTEWPDSIYWQHMLLSHSLFLPVYKGSKSKKMSLLTNKYTWAG